MFVLPSRLAVRWGTLGLLVAGCATEAADGSLTFGPDHGGQTGSLLPTCREEANSQFAVPEGRTALVQGWNELTNPVLKDGSGNVIATAVTQDNDTELVQTAEPLPVGDYTLTYDCGDAGTPVQREITVTEPAPLPTAFGQLELVKPAQLVDCSTLQFVTLKWTPAPEFLPYLDLVELSFVIDGVDFGLVPLGEPLSPDLNGAVLVDIPNCSYFMGTCGLTVGTYELRARVVGGAEQWESMQLPVANVCFRSVGRSEAEGIGCTFGDSARSSSPGICGLAFVACAGLWRANRRKASPAHS